MNQMIVKEFETYLARFARGPSEMDLRVRGLRAEGHLPTVRGRHAPPVTPLQAAMMILSVVAHRAVEAGSLASRIGALPVVPRAGLDIPNGETFAEYLASLISSPAAVAEVPRFHVEIPEDGRFARVVFADGKSILFTGDQHVRQDLEQMPERYDSTGRHAFERRFYMSRSALLELAGVIADDDVGCQIIEEA